MIRRGAAAAAVTMSVLALTTACGGGGAAETVGDPCSGTAGSSDDVRTIEVDVSGETVSPSGDRVDVGVNQPVDIVVTSDQPGELHIHSSPETTCEFDAGTNDPVQLQFDRPGIVEVELHEPVDAPVVELRIE